jgi:hypothetical protein
MKLEKAIEHSKNKLIKTKVCENFGEKEIRILKDRHIDLSDYSMDMNTKRTMINNFSEWCYNYTVF